VAEGLQISKAMTCLWRIKANRMFGNPLSGLIVGFLNGESGLRINQRLSAAECNYTMLLNWYLPPLIA
jgi:hypothetical protein